jgi:phage tail sheath protein FI
MATQQYKTPGVYIQEPNSFPPSIVGVDTAVPCFIGYTEFARDADNRSLKLTPKRIESMAEYVQCFGRGFPEQYYLTIVPQGEKDEADEADEAEEGDDAAPAKPATTPAIPANDQNWGKISLDNANFYRLVEVGDASFNLYNSMRLFFANGGGTCYIISCGLYADGVAAPKMISALAACAALLGPTMVVIPDAVLLKSKAEFDKVAAAMMNMCGKAGDRMAILDVWGAEGLRPRDPWDKVYKVVEDFRAGIRSQVAPEYWRFGAAYFPPLVTSVVSPDEIDISNFSKDADKNAVLKDALTYVVGAAYLDPKATDPSPLPATAEELKKLGTSGLKVPQPSQLNAKGKMVLENYISLIGESQPNDFKPALPKPGETPDLTHRQLTQALVATVPGFQKLLAAVAATQGVLPASGAIAGVWTMNDQLRGVWNAPANTGITTMVMPKLPISHDQQEELNVPVQGLAVNAIRTFQGRGSLIWGARTLDSNSNDWRYIQVRRTMIYVEQSVRQALEAMVFKPNTAQTWVTVVSMIESFLHGLWAAGGLMGGSPNEAYKVQAGLGSTMTPQDVLEGVMRVHITLQMVHPAEFIELTFKQQMLGGA